MPTTWPLAGRSGTVAPDVVERLWWDGLVARVEVPPLARPDAEALAAHIAGHSLDAGRAQRVWALTEGNPLFVRELLLAEGDARPPGAGRSSGRRVADDAVPRLADLVHQRLADLDSAARDLLRAIAFGEPLGAGELDHLAPSATLVALERAGLIAAADDERRLVVRVVHPFYGEVLRAETPPEERRAIRYRLAQGLRATGAQRRVTPCGWPAGRSSPGSRSTATCWPGRPAWPALRRPRAGRAAGSGGLRPPADVHRGRGAGRRALPGRRHRGHPRRRRPAGRARRHR